MLRQLIKPLWLTRIFRNGFELSIGHVRYEPIARRYLINCLDYDSRLLQKRHRIAALENRRWTHGVELPLQRIQLKRLPLTSKPFGAP